MQGENNAMCKKRASKGKRTKIQGIDAPETWASGYHHGSDGVPAWPKNRPAPTKTGVALPTCGDKFTGEPTTSATDDRRSLIGCRLGKPTELNLRSEALST